MIYAITYVLNGTPYTVPGMFSEESLAVKCAAELKRLIPNVTGINLNCMDPRDLSINVKKLD